MSREYALVDPYTLVFYGWGRAQVKRPKVRKSVESEENVPSLFSQYLLPRCEIKPLGCVIAAEWQK